VHHSEYIERLINEGHLKLTMPLHQLMTYHDSCYLGRYNAIYDAPRDIMKLTGGNLVEPENAREKGKCCGGGGAQVWFESHQIKPMNEIRLEQLKATGAETVGTACPFCTIMLSSAAQSTGQEVNIRDIAQLVSGALA
jgi:Fe-S oxidoreductase